MTFQVILVLFILFIAQAALVSGKIRADMIALLVLIALATTGLVSPDQALAGFSDPSVTTVWSMFVISAGLSASGAAGILGRLILKISKRNFRKLLFVLMFSAAALSAFMNNIAVAALLLPVTLDLARKTKVSASHLLMPMSFAILLGGITTLIGTPSNLVASAALRQFTNLELSFTYQTPAGLCCTVIGIIFLGYVTPLLLPARKEIDQEKESPTLTQSYELHNTTFSILIPAESILIGRSLAESHLASAAGLTVSAVIREQENFLIPSGDFILQADDQVIVHGSTEQLKNLQSLSELELIESNLDSAELIRDAGLLLEVKIPSASDLAEKTIAQLNFQDRFAAKIIGIFSNGAYTRDINSSIKLHAGSSILLSGDKESLNKLKEGLEFELPPLMTPTKLIQSYGLKQRLINIRVPQNSSLIEKKIRAASIAASVGLQILQIIRKSGEVIYANSETTVQAEDQILLLGKKVDLEILEGLQKLQISKFTGDIFNLLQSEDVVLIEVALSPRSNLAGSSLKELKFSEKFGFNVLALWRSMRSHRLNLADIKLSFGDALLLQGSRKLFSTLSKNPDLIILSQSSERPFDRYRAITASGILILMLLCTMTGFMRIEIATILAAVLMIASRCISLDDAYRAIDLKSIVLIAGTFPLGSALQTSGTADLLAQYLISLAGGFGALGVMFAIYTITCLLSLIVPNTALVLVMAPIAIKLATVYQISPQISMLLVAIATSASFASPLSHASNLLVMGPGAYKMQDFVRLGLPLAILTMITTFTAVYLFYL